jgi:hypothetical protein
MPPQEFQRANFSPGAVEAMGYFRLASIHQSMPSRLAAFGEDSMRSAANPSRAVSKRVYLFIKKADLLFTRT